MRDTGNLTKAERLERQAPPPHPSPLKGEGVGVGAGDEARADKAEWVRQNFPVCSAFAAEAREAFGDVRMRYAEEGGLRIGSLAGGDSR